jgi:ribosomal protein S18 acetylase RimI-like enzyme
MAALADDVRIRPAGPADKSALALIWDETWRATYGDLLGPEGVRAIGYDESGEVRVDALWPTGNGCVLLASVDEEPAGASVGALRQGVLYIWGMYVRPGFQRRGIGARLVETLARRFTQAKRAEVRVLKASEHARAFYAAQGFSVAGDERRPFGTGADREFWIMAKPLGRGAGAGVREAEPRDLPALARLLGIEAGPFEAGFAALARTGQTLFVAASGDQLVGAAQLALMPDLARGLRARVVLLAGGDAEAAALVALAESRARAAGAGATALEAEPALCRRLGYAPAGEVFSKTL